VIAKRAARVIRAAETENGPLQRSTSMDDVQTFYDRYMSGNAEAWPRAARPQAGHSERGITGGKLEVRQDPTNARV